MTAISVNCWRQYRRRSVLATACVGHDFTGNHSNEKLHRSNGHIWCTSLSEFLGYVMKTLTAWSGPLIALRRKYPTRMTYGSQEQQKGFITFTEVGRQNAQYLHSKTIWWTPIFVLVTNLHWQFYFFHDHLGGLPQCVWKKVLYHFNIIGKKHISLGDLMRETRSLSSLTPISRVSIDGPFANGHLKIDMWGWFSRIQIHQMQVGEPSSRNSTNTTHNAECAQRNASYVLLQISSKYYLFGPNSLSP